MSRYYLGLDIGGTKCAVVLGEETDGDIRVLKKERMDTDLSVSPEEMLGRMCESAKRLSEGYVVEGVGISCGGPLDSKTGRILSPPNLLGWDDVHATEFCSNYLGIKTNLQNDANACGYAEYKFGAGRGSENMIFCTMGTGFGAGLVLNGRLYAGTSDNAGEIGHVRLSAEGPVGYGKRGSVEGYCSGGGIAQLGRIAAPEVLQKGGSTAYCKSVSELDSVSAKSIAIAADNGDETALEVYRECGRQLGRTLSIMIDIINPDTIVIGSVFARSEHLIRQSMQEVIDRECLPGAAGVCKVVPAALGEALGDIAALSVATL